MTTTNTTTTETQTEEQKLAQAALEKKEGEEAFAAGFNKVVKKDETPKNQEKPETTDTDTATEKSAAVLEAEEKAKAEAERKKSEDDAAAKAKAEYDALPKALRDKIDELGKLPGQISTLAGNMGGLNRKLTESLATAKAAAEKKGVEAPSDEQVEAAMADPKAWDKLEEDFPDWAGPMKKELSAIHVALAKKTGGTVDVAEVSKQVKASLTPDLKAVAREAREFAQVDIRHEGWEDTVKTPEFGGWLKTQPAETQALANSDRGRDAIRLLDAYKVHTDTAAKAAQDSAAKEKARQEKERRLAGAVSPRGTSAAPETGISDEAAFAKGFNKVRKVKTG